MIVLRNKLFVEASYKNKKQKKDADLKKKKLDISRNIKRLEKVYKEIDNSKSVRNNEVEKRIISSRNDVFLVKDSTKRLVNNIPLIKKDNQAGIIENKERVKIISRNLGFETKYSKDPIKLKAKEELDNSLDSGKKDY